MSYRDTFWIWFKRTFREVYYWIREGSVAIIDNPKILNGYKWIESRSCGRSYLAGYYELDLLRCLSHFLKADSTFFDVGGHAGYISLYGSRLAKRVFTFEPQISNFEFLKKIMLLNEVANVFPSQVAVGSKSGKVFFENGLTSSTGKISSHGNIPTELISIDEFIETNNIDRLDLIKIDVEGFGGEVLKGMKTTIGSLRPIIFFELHNAEELDELKKLTSMNYNFFSTNMTQVILESLQNQFVLAVPAEHFL